MTFDRVRTIDSFRHGVKHRPTASLTKESQTNDVDDVCHSPVLPVIPLSTCQRFQATGVNEWLPFWPAKFVAEVSKIHIVIVLFSSSISPMTNTLTFKHA